MRFIFCILACLAATRVLTGQSRWDRQIDARLTQAAATLGHSYRAAGIAGRGTLNTGESATFSIALPSNVTTVLTGVCDADCVDLDLSLSTNGYDTDAARGGGNAPIVRGAPTVPTIYRITVHMGECRHNPCWYGIGMFRQSRTDIR